MTDKKKADRKLAKQRISAEDIPTIREETFAYITRKAQGEYTLEDYYALPDDQRAELIDGVIYDMTAPNFNHQLLASRLHMALFTYILANKGKCFVLEAPLNVQLDCDEKTMVQPDVIVLCDHGKRRGFGIFGAPDLVVEVLSPSTRKKDLGIKLEKTGEG